MQKLPERCLNTINAQWHKSCDDYYYLFSILFLSTFPHFSKSRPSLFFFYQDTVSGIFYPHPKVFFYHKTFQKCNIQFPTKQRRITEKSRKIIRFRTKDIFVLMNLDHLPGKSTFPLFFN